MMINAKINNIQVEVPKGTSILEAAKDLGIEIPVLCKHPDLPSSAACGICVVKDKKYNKMIRSCCTELETGMELETHTPEIIKVRRSVLELILSAHPNSCLSCGKNGNCELQSLASEFAMRTSRFDTVIKNKEIDYSTGSIVFDAEKCIKCGRCIEVCQNKQDVWALSFLDRGIHTRIAPAGDISLAESPCVRCGQCNAHCPVGAIYEHDETQLVLNALMDNDKYCVVQIAPAVRVAIGEAFGLQPGVNLTGQLYYALRSMGFKGVFDTNFGADVTVMEEATEFVNRYTAGKGKLPLITTCCPSWVDFMEKRYSDLIPHFSSCKSPMAITGVLSKTYYAEKLGIDPSKIFMVAIMPCTAKKFETKRGKEMYASGFPDVDVSITNRELARMLKQMGFDMPNLPKGQPDNLLGKYTGSGVIFGSTGGVMEAALRTAYYMITDKPLENIDITPVRGFAGVKESMISVNGNILRTAVAHGLNNVQTVLNRVKEALAKGEPSPYDFIEVMACPGGCIGGGGMGYKISQKIRRERMRGLYREDEHLVHMRSSFENPYIQKLYSEFLEKPGSHKAHELLHTTYKPRAEYKK
jgi:NADH-quinone oxidoreductase subunit G